MQRIQKSDIRPGDHIRIEYGADYFDKEMLAREIVASAPTPPSALFSLEGPGITLYLIKRPVPVPTKPGVYMYGEYALYTLDDVGRWFYGGVGIISERIAAMEGEEWTLLQRASEVALEIITLLDNVGVELAFGDPLDYDGIITQKYLQNN